MKKFLTCLAVIASMAGLSQIASADVIVDFTTSEGVGLGDTNETGSASLTSFSTAGFVYTGLVGGTSVSTAPTTIWANTLTDPGAATAIGDLNLATGTLNGQAVYGLPSISAGDTIFVFGNGNNGGVTPPGGANGDEEILFFAADGSTLVGTISNDVFFQDSPTNSVRPPNLVSFDVNRSVGNPIAGRTVSGFVIDPLQINFGTGFTAADIGGINLNDNGIDIQDVGIATIATAVPEPSSAIILVSGLGALLVRRRK